MKEINLKIKKLYENVPTPTYGTEGSACIDLTAMSRFYDKNGNVVYGTGIAMEIPEGYVGLLFPRSSITKKDIIVKNCVGVIDSDYRGEVMLKCCPTLGFGNYDNCNTDGEVILEKRYGIDIDQDFYEDTIHLDGDLNNHYGIGDKCCQIMLVEIPKLNIEVVDELSNTERGVGGYGHTGN